MVWCLIAGMGATPRRGATAFSAVAALSTHPRTAPAVAAEAYARLAQAPLEEARAICSRVFFDARGDMRASGESVGIATATAALRSRKRCSWEVLPWRSTRLGGHGDADTARAIACVGSWLGTLRSCSTATRTMAILSFPSPPSGASVGALIPMRLITNLLH